MKQKKNMKNSIIIGVICLCLCSCGRKSARMSEQSYPHRSTTQQQKTRNQKVANSPKQTSTNQQRRTEIMSGTEIFEKFNTAVFMIYTSDGISAYQGSGFFITSSGVAVSNYHVFKGTAIGYEQIKLSNGKTYKLKEIIAKSEAEDYILFRVESNGDKFTSIPVAQSKSKIGEKVYAIGSPRGLVNTFSSGEISQFRDGHLIQISTPIDHGSSGGALINSYGEVIGITTSGLDDSGANLNFAVDISVLRKHF